MYEILPRILVRIRRKVGFKKIVVVFWRLLDLLIESHVVLELKYP